MGDSVIPDDDAITETLRSNGIICASRILPDGGRISQTLRHRPRCLAGVIGTTIIIGGGGS